MLDSTIIDSTIISLIFLFCWGAFFLVWIGGALYNVLKGPKTLRTGANISRRVRIGIIGILLAWLAISSTTSVQTFLLSILVLRVPELQVVGAILLIAGTLFTLWSRLVLGTMWSSRAAVKSDHRLRTDGPYGITRHPMYTGALGMLVGSALVFLVFFPVAAMGFAVFSSRISAEEELLAQQFGEQYAEYKQRVPKLIPGVHIKKRH